MRSLFLLPLLFPVLTMAEPVHIPGPQGPLEAEMIAVEGASDAVIIIPGSGPIDRDGNAPPMGLSTDAYRMLGEGLAEQGIASLRIDKRGFYGSAGAISDPDDVTIEAYAQDARNWVAYTSRLAPCVWLAGHSEGGLVALMAAQGAPEDLCGLILLAASGRPIGQLMIEQFEANPANEPLMPELRDLVAGLEAGKSRNPVSVTPVLQPLFSAGLQRYMIDLFSHDPVKIAKEWGGPALIVQGNEDMQVRPHDADLLEAALPDAHRLNLAGGTHMLKTSVAGNPYSTYVDSALPLHEALVPGIARFIEETTTAE
ncbi:alpha/beta fold hydrolase [Pseudotabrizicola sp. 4114]|uniref:alpha/beta hydrolase n=1 Tax=Pseudotabrizicola sp. 4114 TaxID=2817731 RepID=UPI00285832C4|nr:pimeloyl-ACP methyl ester carboxylesterase [Pseudorhodobacter sp. 4114]